MPRRKAFARRGLTCAAALFAVAAAGSAHAQNAPDAPAQIHVPPPVAAAATPAAAAAMSPAAPTVAAAETPAAAPAAPAVDPSLVQVREQLSGSLRGVDRGDKEALAAFYATHTGPLLWVAGNGFTARGRNAIAEIQAADDWGLPAAAFSLPQPPADGTPATLADAEITLGLAVLKYARYARGGRIEPSYVSRNFDQKPQLRDPKTVIEAVAATDAPGAYLRGLHPKHPQFEKLRQALLKARAGSTKPEPAEELQVHFPDGPALKLGVKNPQVALLRQRLKLPAAGGAEDVFDAQVLDAVKAFQKHHGIQPTGVVGGQTRAALNGAAKARPVGSDVERLVMNMERWRWLPEDLGAFYVWDNIPEFMARVVKNNHVIHSAKIVVGKVDAQTVIFSANMRYVVFHPEWGVPDSIKVKELLPYLRPTQDVFSFFGGGSVSDTRILQRHNLRVSYNGQPVDPASVNWQSVDIKRFTFIQPGGAGNVLGVVKFRFPNKHDIYMHDTPQRELFEKSVRAYSHGCMRVQNPGRLAEILLEEDKGWTSAHVRQLLASGYNNEVALTKQIPVHVTYFTAMADDDGQIRYFADLYGHDRRMAAALSGKSLAPEPVADAEAPQPRRSRTARRPPANENPFSALFGN
jgi:murein L,D-transpeptidase YcbB/YkuD